MKKIYLILTALVVLLIPACGSDRQKKNDTTPVVAADSIQTDTTSNNRSADTTKRDTGKSTTDSVTKKNPK
ncbi:hypothetical protein [Pedobacter lusitanus]|uniref:hypothetical protein n=1 Tax=Pedobacter lusitanus TaxID=1503925 RepID=UPI0032AF74F2